MAAPEQVVPEGSAEHGDPVVGQGYVRTVWGGLKRGADPLAVYCARWTIGRKELGADLLVSIGGWGVGEDEAARRAFGFRLIGSGARGAAPGPKAPLEPHDASAVAWSTKLALGKLVTKDEHASEPLAADALRLAGRVVADDERVRAFLTRAGRETRTAAELVERAYQRVNDSDDVAAEVDATKALGFDPEAWDAYFMRGWARARGEQWDDAIADLELYLQKAGKGKHAPRATKVVEMARKKKAALAAAQAEAVKAEAEPDAGSSTG